MHIVSQASNKVLIKPCM